MTLGTALPGPATTMETELRGPTMVPPGGFCLSTWPCGLTGWDGVLITTDRPAWASWLLA